MINLSPTKMASLVSNIITNLNISRYDLIILFFVPLLFLYIYTTRPDESLISNISSSLSNKPLIFIPMLIAWIFRLFFFSFIFFILSSFSCPFFSFVPFNLAYMTTAFETYSYFEFFPPSTDNIYDVDWVLFAHLPDFLFL